MVVDGDAGFGQVRAACLVQPPAVGGLKSRFLQCTELPQTFDGHRHAEGGQPRHVSRKVRMSRVRHGLAQGPVVPVRRAYQFGIGPEGMEMGCGKGPYPVEFWMNDDQIAHVDIPPR